MKAFLVGVLVLAMMAILAVVGVLLLPLLLVLGLFLRVVISFALILFIIWLIGKLTLMAIEHLKKREGSDQAKNE